MKYNYELHCLFKEPDITIIIKVARMRQHGHIIRINKAVMLEKDSCSLNPEITDKHANKNNNG
jgi:hypothetical protein